jgi:23S rRNA U2552 (ribose-2'-O)-methylase RlmE/FtsJ
MTYYLLPEIVQDINKNTIGFFNLNEEMKYINPSLYNYLNESKANIDKYKEQWDNIKKLTNPYEYIHSNIPGFKLSVSQLKPLSRSFYKLIEIINTFNLLKENQPIKSFHMAEGPGGFIEAILKYRHNINDKYYGMTLENSDINIPGWKKSNKLLQENKNIIIERGITNTGDLFNYENYKYITEKYNNKFDFITADGGFDFSIDYNSQEFMASKLILTEILYALSIQKTNGTFILKVFDIYYYLSIDFLYLLGCFYSNVYIYKPNTSRYANSEKYIICKNFNSNNKDLYNIFDKMNKEINNFNFTRIFNIQIPLLFVSSIENLNSIFGEQQLDNIITTLLLLDSYKGKKEKLELFKKNNITKCIQWCEINNIPYNKKISNKNIFLT